MRPCPVRFVNHGLEIRRTKVQPQSAAVRILIGAHPLTAPIENPLAIKRCDANPAIIGTTIMPGPCHRGGNIPSPAAAHNRDQRTGMVFRMLNRMKSA